MLYGNKTQFDIVFRDELDEMQASQSPPLTVTHILSGADESWTGERGHIDAEKIDRLIGGIESTTGVYVCGPEKMTRQVIAAMRDRGVQTRQIHAESFSLMNDTSPTSSSSVWRKRATLLVIALTMVLTLVVATIRAGGPAAGEGHQHSHDHSHGEASQENSPQPEKSHDH